MDKKTSNGHNGQSNGHNGQENVWLTFITDNKDFLVSFRTRVRKISSALYMLGNLWQEDDFGKHLQSVSLTILAASKIPVTDNREYIMHHFMSVKESVEYALSLIIFGAEAGLLATSNVVMITPFCVALLGDLHDLENTLPSLFDAPRTTGKRTTQAPSIEDELVTLFAKEHGEAYNTANTVVTTNQVAPITEAEEEPEADMSDANTIREAIFNAIKESKTRTPGELQEQFETLNSKRIQRELQQLAQEGRIVKKGEKRWVTYHLAR